MINLLFVHRFFDCIVILIVQLPIRRGVVGPTLMIEEAGRQKVNHGVKLLRECLNCFEYMKLLLVVGGSRIL